MEGTEPKLSYEYCIIETVIQRKKGIQVESSSEEEEAGAMAIGQPGELPPSESEEEESSEEDDVRVQVVCQV